MSQLSSLRSELLLFSVFLSSVACGSDGAGSGTTPPVSGSGLAGAAAVSGSGGAGHGPISGFGAQPDLAGAPAFAGAPAATSGSGGNDAPADCGKLTQMAQVKLGPADIVWIIDGSASMFDELAAVQENIEAFATSIAAAGIDHHVVMLAGGDLAANTKLGMDPAHYLFVPSAVGSNNALDLLLAQYDQYKAFLRPEASLNFVVVTDDNSFTAGADFKAQMEMVAGKKFMFHAIASESVDGLPCTGACGIPLVCGAFSPGIEYYSLADSTGGQKISICTADWSQVFGPLQKAVIESAPLPCDYAIPAPPAGESLDPNKVNFDFSAPSTPKMTFPHAASQSACADKVAWYYDDPNAPRQIKMCPAGCQAISAGGTIEIRLGCETVPLIVN